MAESGSPRARGIFLSATDTGVGKTFVGARLIAEFTRRGLAVAARKPVESGCERVDGDLHPADATALWAAAGRREPLATVCPFRFHHAVSPPRAAALAGTTLTLDQLEAAARRDTGHAFLHVEGAGGICSPIAADGLNADLARALGLPVLLVVPDRLGGINQALMGEAAARARGLAVAAIVLNRGQAEVAAELDNRAELRRFTGCPVFPVGYGEAAEVGALADFLLDFASGE